MLLDKKEQIMIIQDEFGGTRGLLTMEDIIETLLGVEIVDEHDRDAIKQGTTGEDVDGHVKLLMLCNDVTLRNLIPPELKKGFGFFNSKPATAFSPFAVTPDELNSSWQNGRVHLNLKTIYNGEVFGDVAAGPEMHFSFRDIVGHIAKTRSFTAGTIVGSGTVSNEDTSKGSSCLSEKRMLEKIATGEFKTPYMKVGDRIEIEMFDEQGHSIFGRIDQKIVSPSK